MNERKIVILGASNKADRTSYTLLKRLQTKAEFSLIPINPALKDIDGLPVLSKLEEAPKKPDILSIYLNAQRSQELESAILDLQPQKVIFNPGAENPELMAKLKAQGAQVEEACSLILLSLNQL